MARRRLPNGTKPRAIAMMVEGASNRAISETCAVNAATVSAWRNEPDVAAQVEREQAAMLAAAAAKIGAAAESCVDMLLAIVNWKPDPTKEDDRGPGYRERIAAAEALLKRTALEAHALAKLEAARRKSEPSTEEQLRFNAEMRTLVMGEVEREIATRDLVPRTVAPVPSGPGAEASGRVE